jgi:hypothetical protein
MIVSMLRRLWLSIPESISGELLNFDAFGLTGLHQHDARILCELDGGIASGKPNRHLDFGAVRLHFKG